MNNYFQICLRGFYVSFILVFQERIGIEGNTYCVYPVLVTRRLSNTDNRDVIFRRYSEFQLLHVELKKRYTLRGNFLGVQIFKLTEYENRQNKS